MLGYKQVTWYCLMLKWALIRCGTHSVGGLVSWSSSCEPLAGREEGCINVNFDESSF